MDWAVYGALIVGALATAGAAAFLAVRALQAWRAFKRFRRQLAKALQSLADAAERTSQAAERAADQSKLEQRLAGLRHTLRVFNVLRAALDEVDDTFRRVAAVYPRK